MANIDFTAFVEDAIRAQTGGVFVLKTAETHSKKDENGKYQTVARTFRDVKVSRESGINLDAYAKGDRVSIRGREVTEKRAGAEGKDFYSLVVWADSIDRAGSGNAPVPSAVEPDPWKNTPSWETASVPADDGLPF